MTQEAGWFVCKEALKNPCAYTRTAIFYAALWSQKKRSRSSLAARSYIAQIDGSKEPEVERKEFSRCFLEKGGKCSKSWLRAKCRPNEAWKAKGWHWWESQTPSPSNSPAELRMAPAEGEVIPFSKNVRTKVLTEKKPGKKCNVPCAAEEWEENSSRSTTISCRKWEGKPAPKVCRAAAWHMVDCCH